MPVARPVRLLALALGTGGTIGLGLIAVAPAALADCQPDPAAMGTTVTCSATDGNGFDAGAVDEIDVTVQGAASVTNDGSDNTSAIRLNDRNTVQVDTGGTVSATGMNSHGIEIGNDNDATNMGATTPDGVTNQGAIFVGGASSGGILGGDRDDVTNDGAITAGAPGVSGAFGIRVGNDGTVVNGSTGTVTVTGPGATGIEVGTNTQDGTADLTNQGRVTIGGEDGAATGLTSGAGNDVVNSGTVVVSGNSAMLAAPVLGVQMGDGSALTNSGRIDVTGTGGQGVVVTGGATGTSITNTPAGQVLTDVSGGEALDLSATTGGTNTIVNDGILAAGTVAMPGVAIRGSDSAIEDVTSSGLITGDVLLGGGNDVLTLRTGSAGTGMLDGGVGTNALNLQGLGLGTLDLDRVLNFGTLVLDDMGMAGELGTWRLSGAAAFPGGVSLQNGRLSLSDTVSITGDYTQLNDSTLSILIDPNAGTNGRLDLLGGSTATLSGGSNALEVIQIAPVPSNTVITVLDASAGGGSIVGNFDILPADTTLLSFNLLPMGNRIDLQILRASYASVAQTPNQGSTARYLDRLLATGGNGPGVGGALVQLDALSAPQLRAAFDSLQPEVYDAHTGVMASLGRAFANAAASPRLLCKPRFFGLDPGPLNDLPCGRTGFTAWMRLLFSEWNRDAGSDFLDYDGASRGVAAGFDWRPDRRLTATGYVGLGSADFDVDPVGDGQVQSFEIGAAVQARLGGARARASFGYGRGNHKQDRRLRLGTINVATRGEFDSNRLQGLAELGWLFELGGLQLEPRAELDFAWIQEDPFSEDDVGGIELDVAQRTNTLFSTEFGGRLRYRHFQNPYSDTVVPYSQGTWTPEVSAAWRSTWAGADRSIDAQLTGAAPGTGSFSTDAEDSQQGADLGARLTFQPHGSGGSFSIGYDGFFGDKSTDHRFGADVEVYF